MRLNAILFDSEIVLYRVYKMDHKASSEVRAALIVVRQQFKEQQFTITNFTHACGRLTIKTGSV